MIDKTGVFDRVDGSVPVILDLGCGPASRRPGAIGVDRIDREGVDIVGDALEVLERFPDDSVGGVESFHFLEHQPDVDPYMAELARVMRPEAHLTVVAPHFSNPHYYSDPTHETPFGLYTFCYYCRESPLRRQVPRYTDTQHFDLTSVDLLFKSSPPFYVRHGMKKVAQLVFNANRYMRELYEENFCFLVPCYEVRYEMVRL